MSITPNIGINYTLSDVGQELEGMMHGTTLNQITDLFGVYNRAARRVLDDVDPAETKVNTQFGQVWDQVFTYSIPLDLKGNKIIDLYPQANRQMTDNFGQTYNKPFDLSKNFAVSPDFSVFYSNGVRTLAVNATELNTGIQINAADGINTNGTWAASGNASNVQTDNQFYTSGSAGSVSFTLNQTGVVGSTGSVSNSTMGQVNLSQHFNNAFEFFYVYLPSASAITNIDYQFGSSATAYWEFASITTDYMGNGLIDGWNLCGASWTTATQVGSPNDAAINFIKVTLTYNGVVQTQVRINQFWSRLGVIFNINYYSKYLFRDGVTNVFKEQATSEDDFINLDTDGRNLFVYAAALTAVQQQQGLSATFFDEPTLEASYNDALAEYQGKYRSEITKPRNYYYRQNAQGYRRWLGGGGYWR